ncbi:MAG: DUF916 domain-containing protein [Candidatus Saccharimonadales bacterium]
MIRRRFSALLAGVALILTIAISPAAQVTAATTPAASTVGGNGMKVSPVRTDITINPGQTNTVTVNVQNVTSVPAELQVLVNDFVADKSESGQPAIILDASKYAPSHSLKRFITATIPNITLQPNEQKSVKITINVPKDAAGGGYFGAIRFAPASSTNDKNISLSASVGSLILLKVPGDIKDDLRLASLDVRKGDSVKILFTSGKNIKTAIRFENKGDIQEQPFGKIVLKQGNKILQTTEVNNTDPRGNVLPDSVRKFEVTLDKVGSFGKYNVQGNFGYGTTGQLLSGQTTFYVVPVPIIVLAVIIVLAILFLIFGLPKMIRRYNQGVIRKASRRR